MSTLISFMYVFGFKLLKYIDSTILIGIVFTFYFLINKKYREIVLKKILNKNFIKIIIAFSLIILWSLIATVLGGMHDLTYVKTLIHLFLVIIIGYQVCCFYEMKDRQSKIISDLMIAFLIQSILQWVFYLLPDLSKFFNIFRSEAMISKSIEYHGYRGIAITTSGFFSLSSAYALVFVLYFTKYNTLFKKSFTKYLFFIVLVTGTFFAGRTGFVGLIFVTLLILTHIKPVINKKNLYNFLIILIVILISIVLFKNIKNNTKIQAVYNFAFELIENYKNGKGLQTSSTNNLLNMYKIDFSEKTFLIGDGIYSDTDITGRNIYYKNVDIGYFRKILYFGIVGLLLSIYLEKSILVDKNKKIEYKIIFLLMLVLELKGEIIGLNIMFNSIIVLFSNASLIPSEKENIRKE